MSGSSIDMNEQQYNNQSLNEYLLGALPVAQAERFDELSFTDEEFTDALNVAEKDLVDAYIQNELSGATLDKFETHYLSSPLRREKVEFARAFQVFAGKNSAKTSAVAETEPKRNFFEFFSGIFTISRPSLQWSFALAALAFMFFGGWLLLENSRLRFEMSEANANRDRLLQRETELAGREKQLQGEIADQRSANSETENQLAQVREERAQLDQQLKKQTQEQQRLSERRKLDEQPRAARKSPPGLMPFGGIASFILAPSLRGGTRIQAVSIPANTATVAATLELEADEYIAYRAVLRSPSDNRVLWQSGKLKSKVSGGNTRIYIGFPAKFLEEEIYSIEVSGISADGETEIISDFSFRVMR